LVPEAFIVEKFLPHLCWQACQNLRVYAERIIVGGLLLLLGCWLLYFFGLDLTFNLRNLLSWLLLVLLLLGRRLPVDLAEHDSLQLFW
jgi:hypothetical protein